MSRSRWRLAAYITAGSIALAVVLFAMGTPLLSLVGRQLVHTDPLERVDVMIVLAGEMDRVVEAAELYRGGYAPLIILTTEPPDPVVTFLRSRGVPAETTVEKSRGVLHALGVGPEAVVTLDDVIGSTADEARGFARWASAKPVRSVMVITSPFHTARARLTFLHALRGRGVRVITRPSTLAPFRSDNWWQSRATLRDGSYEIQKLLYYRIVELRGSAE